MLAFTPSCGSHGPGHVHETLYEAGPAPPPQSWTRYWWGGVLHEDKTGTRPRALCRESAVLSLAGSELLLAAASPGCADYLGGYTGMGGIWVSLLIVCAGV